MRTVREKEIKLAHVSLVIVFGKFFNYLKKTWVIEMYLTVFIICHSLKFIPNMYEIRQGVQTSDVNLLWPKWIEYAASLSHLLITLNASSDVFIYFIKHRSELCSHTSEPNLETAAIEMM